MNIGIFTDTYFPQLNGVATSVQTLRRELEKRGHQVYIFTPYDPRQQQETDDHIFRLPSMPFIFVKNYRACFVCPPHILRKIHQLKLDIIHTQTEFSLGFLGKLISTTFGIPMVHTYHTMYEDYVHYIAGGHLISAEGAREFSRIFCNTAMAVIAPTQKTERLLLSYGVNKPISIIPTGIDTSHFRKSNYDPVEILELRHSLGLKADTPVLISIGRIAKEKSIDVIIGALPKLLEKLPNTMMVIVGEGMEIENLKKYADSLGIGDHLLFTGGKPWSEIGKYYQLGDVFCSASLSETQGLTFAEAMAGGIPVVARRDDCIVNFMTHGETGMFFDDPAELPDLLYRVLTDKPLREHLSTTSQNTMESLSVETFGNHVEELYEKVVRAFQNAESIPLHSLPYIKGTRVVHRISKIPKKLAHRSRSYSSQIAERLPFLPRHRS